MALFHFNVSQIKRSAGQSAIACAAYRAGEKLHSERYNEDNDFTRKGGVVYSEILLPEHVPREYLDRETLWNSVERTERRADAQLAYSFEVSLQKEFSREENIAMMREYLSEQFVSRGMIVDVSMHEPETDGDPNLHFHFMIPMRPVMEDGSWGPKQKAVTVTDEHGRQRKNYVSVTGWNSPELLEEWRRTWCERCNAKFAEKGLPERIDWRSYERQGSELLPQAHEGPAVHAMEKRGVPTGIGDYNRFVRSVNAAIRSLRKKLQELSVWIQGAKEKLSRIPERPSLPSLLLDYMAKAQSGVSSVYRKSNILKDVSQAIRELDDMGISTPDELDSRITEVREKVNALSDGMKEKYARMKTLREALRQWDIYRENYPVHEELKKSKYRFKKARADYEESHRSQLILFRTARRILMETGGKEKVTPAVVKGWREELHRLEKEYEAAYAELPAWREQQKKLSHIRYCIDQVQEQPSRPHRSHEQER